MELIKVNKCKDNSAEFKNFSRLEWGCGKSVAEHMFCISEVLGFYPKYHKYKNKTTNDNRFIGFLDSSTY